MNTTQAGVPQYEPEFDQADADAVAAYMAGGGWLTEFKQTQLFEDRIREITGSRFAIACCNGTVALTLAAMASGLQPGDKVIVPNYTMIATPNAFQLLGAQPLFVDVEPETLCLDLELARRCIESDPAIRGVALVLANGRTPNRGMEEFLSICAQRNLVLVEDAAQGLGSHYPDGRHVGTLGAVGTLSFSTPKIISTGQGGMVLTQDEETAQRLRSIKDFGRTQSGTDIHDILGYNFKFTDLQAVVGLSQCDKLKVRMQRKKAICQRYQECLEKIPQVKCFQHDLNRTTPWFIDILTTRRDELEHFLLQNGIRTRRMYPPIHAQKAWGLQGHYPVSEMVGRDGLWLPSHPQLTEDTIHRICDTIRNFFDTNSE